MPKNQPIDWRNIASITLLWVAAIAGAALLWPQPKALPMPAPVIAPPEPFVPSPAFEATNDLAVLRAALQRQCKGRGYSVLSSQPIANAGSRSDLKRGTFPNGLDCPGVKVVDSDLIEALFDKPDPHKIDFKFRGGWANFYKKYPDASGVIYLSLPSYPSANSAVVYLDRTGCFRCGAGWELVLVRVGKTWVVRDEKPRWIA